MGPVSEDGDAPLAAAGSVRFATFNTALTHDVPGALLARLQTGHDLQARRVAETVRRVRPDVLVLQELDRDGAQRSLAVLRERYLAKGERGAEGIRFAHSVFPASNTGIRSPVDLDGDGIVHGPGDALGFGHHPGQFAFAVLSRFPLHSPRTFARLLWRDVPDGAIPPGHYSAAAEGVLPLSSKTHLMVSVETSFGPVALLAAHPTPPTFDEPPARWNARRNHDEIRLLADLLRAESSRYATDDAGRAGGLPQGAMAVVAGDLNADPARGEAFPGAIDQLLRHPDIDPVEPRSSHGAATATFGDGLRVDYVLPTRSLRVTGSGVFWPDEKSPLADLNAASDHRLVWVDVTARDGSGFA